MIATNTSTSTGGSPFNVLDDHFYNSPAWFVANSNHYDNAARGSYKIFVGEWAANEGSPTNDMNSKSSLRNSTVGTRRPPQIMICSDKSMCSSRSRIRRAICGFALAITLYLAS